ncbi:hypothetical protein BAE44_0002527 [Dichanthelium oligosanthes]|uniref:Uncharacterized protein n=1 Tax=Dichanthelium oligosanthes TaxID=888268 RepID=A0A1E5WGI0_9POAL|nr:hypothetical protein BAE44_0002527 [Dichanthelium oligosanthes]
MERKESADFRREGSATCSSRIPHQTRNGHRKACLWEPRDPLVSYKYRFVYATFELSFIYIISYL